MNQTNAPPSSAGGTKLVVVALSLAFVAVVIVNVYINHIKSVVAQSSFTVYRLNRTIEPGDNFNAKRDVSPVRVPDSFKDALQGFVKDDEVAALNGDPVLRTARQGDFLGNNVFTPTGRTDDYPRPRIGYRFVRLPINNRNVPGTVQPDMIVDIEAPFSIGGAVPVVMPVMESVRVIAVGTRTAGDVEEGRGRPTFNFYTITIEVTPEQATQLSMIERMAIGEFELHLRNPADSDHPKIPGGGINKKLLDMLSDMQKRGVPAGATTRGG